MKASFSQGYAVVSGRTGSCTQVWSPAKPLCCANTTAQCYKLGCVSEPFLEHNQSTASWAPSQNDGFKAWEWGPSSTGNPHAQQLEVGWPAALSTCITFQLCVPQPWGGCCDCHCKWGAHHSSSQGAKLPYLISQKPLEARTNDHPHCIDYGTKAQRI